MLTGLAPWMENLSIAAHWSGTWCERLLKSMYYVTLRHGSELPQEIERLWSTLAVNKRNIVPMLDFLLGLGMHYAYQVGGWVGGWEERGGEGTRKGWACTIPGGRGNGGWQGDSQCRSGSTAEFVMEGVTNG
jgi:hypothetical protein